MKTQITDNSSTQDRLNVAFAQIRKHGILARQRFSCCGGCASYELATDLKKPKNAKKIGAVYYHKQDAQNLDNYQNFYLGFGGNPATSKDNEAKETAQAIEVGQIVVNCLKAVGLDVEWNGSHETRICIKQEKPSWMQGTRFRAF